jgi:hypothetical protein
MTPPGPTRTRSRGMIDGVPMVARWRCRSAAPGAARRERKPPSRRPDSGGRVMPGGYPKRRPGCQRGVGRLPSAGVEGVLKGFGGPPAYSAGQCRGRTAWRGPGRFVRFPGFGRIRLYFEFPLTRPRAPQAPGGPPRTAACRAGRRSRDRCRSAPGWCRGRSCARPSRSTGARIPASRSGRDRAR